MSGELGVLTLGGEVQLTEKVKGQLAINGINVGLGYTNKTETVTTKANVGNVKFDVEVANSEINGTYSILKVEDGKKTFNTVELTSQQNILQKNDMIGAEVGCGLKIGFGVNWNQLVESFKHF